MDRLFSPNRLFRGPGFEFRSWIAPDSILNGGIVCNECFMLLQASDTTEEVPAPQYGHQQVCFGCGKSILRSQSYRVSLHCPER
ncbi:hypothetical protein evm_014711 [Chilo suppressalis]|nr:hypothetical protein evm_014711 [Chilo suppressalis]